MSQITLLLLGSKTFAGKLGKDEKGNEVLDDCIEFTLMFNPQSGQMMIGGMVLGTMERIHKDSVFIQLTKDSPFHIKYYQLTTNLTLT